MSTPLPQVTSPSAASSPRATRRTPSSVGRRRGRENGTPRRRRSRSRSVGNPSYGSPGTPGTPGTPVASPAYHTPVGNVGTPFGTPVGTPSFLRGTYPFFFFFECYVAGFVSCISMVGVCCLDRWKRMRGSLTVSVGPSTISAVSWGPRAGRCGEGGGLSPGNRAGDLRPGSLVLM